MSNEATATRIKYFVDSDGALAFIETEIRVRGAASVQTAGPDSGLTITATIGYVLSRRQAAREALDHLIDYFEENSEAIQDINSRFDRHFRTARGTARFCQETDDMFATSLYRSGVDVRFGGRMYRNRVLTCHSFGCQHDAIAEHFPEFAPLISQHLNLMSGETLRPETLAVLARL